MAYVAERVGVEREQKETLLVVLSKVDGVKKGVFKVLEVPDLPQVTGRIKTPFCPDGITQLMDYLVVAKIASEVVVF